MKNFTVKLTINFHPCFVRGQYGLLWTLDGEGWHQETLDAPVEVGKRVEAILTGLAGGRDDAEYLYARHRELARKVVFNTATPEERAELERVRDALDADEIVDFALGAVPDMEVK